MIMLNVITNEYFLSNYQNYGEYAERVIRGHTRTRVEPTDSRRQMTLFGIFGPGFR